MATSTYERTESGSASDERLWGSSAGAVEYDNGGMSSLRGSGKPANRRFKLSKRDLVNLTSQMAIMTRSGVDICSVLDTLARRSRRPLLRDMLISIRDSVEGGNPFSIALEQYGEVFSPTFIASVSAGEASGRLPEVLSQLAQLLRSELRLNNSVRTMMAYPILLMSVSGVVLMGLVLFVLPQFAKIFNDYETPLPLLTRVLIAIATELRTRFWLWLPLLVLGISGLASLRFSQFGRRLMDRMMLNVVLLRDVTRMLFTGRVLRLLGLMLESGVPLLDSLRLSKLAVGNSLYRELFELLEEEVLNGRGLGTALATSTFIPPGAAEMVMTAEKTGSLATVTRDMGEFFEEEGEAKLRELITFIEPLITVVMGVLVAIVVMAVMLPMFDMSSLASRGG
ncbi:MAG: type II secretion system F family protein [Pirellulaceae bacterium]